MRIIHVVDDFTAENAGVTSSVVEMTRTQTVTAGVVAAGSRAITPPAGVDVQLSPYSPHGVAWRYAPGLRDSLQQQLAAADAVHVHGVWMHPQVCAMRVARDCVRPTVITPHNMLGGWVWQQGGGLRRIKKSVYWAMVCGRLFRRATVVHALSPIERDNIRHFFPGQRIEVVPNSIDVGAVRRQLELAEDMAGLPDRYTVFLGRLHPVKGVHLILQAMALLQEKERLPLVIIGPEEDPVYAALLHGLVARHGLTRWVIFRGAVFGAQKFSIMRRALALLAPSYSEGISMAALEAMACAVPVVTTREAGIIHIENGGGMLVSPAAEALVPVLRAVQAWSDSERQERGAVALDFVGRLYGRDVVGEQYRALYASLL